MSSDQRRQLAKRILDSREFRHALTDTEATNRISHQLKAMMRDRGWQQLDLAKESGIASPLISNYVRGYQKYSVQTLKRLARAFDTHLVVGFAPYSEAVDWISDLDPSKLAPPAAENDQRLRAMSRVGLTAAAHTGESATAGTTAEPNTLTVLGGAIAADLDASTDLVDDAESKEKRDGQPLAA